MKNHASVCLSDLQFAGGFDSETMQAFEELRNLARPPNTQQEEDTT